MAKKLIKETNSIDQKIVEAELASVTVENNTPKTKPAEEKPDDSKEKSVSVEQKLISLFSLQQIDSQVDKIRIIRGELPLEVQDLEDEIGRAHV